MWGNLSSTKCANADFVLNAFAECGCRREWLTCLLFPHAPLVHLRGGFSAGLDEFGMRNVRDGDEAALEVLAVKASGERLVVVLEPFPYQRVVAIGLAHGVDGVRGEEAPRGDAHLREVLRAFQLRLEAAVADIERAKFHGFHHTRNCRFQGDHGTSQR